MAGEIKTLEFSEGVSVSSPFDAGSGSGTGEVNFVANNNGASDLDQSQTDDVGDWIDSGTGTTSSITTSSGEIPRFPFQETAIKITNDGSGTAYTQIRFRVPPADRGKKLKIEFAQKPDGSVYASGDFTLELYNYSDNYVTSEAQLTIVGLDNGIPNQTGVSFFEFDADDREYYELRFVRSAGTAAGFIAINDFVIGPGKLHSGAVVTAWEAFTATWNSDDDHDTGGTPVSTTYFRRVGESMEIRGRYVPQGDGTDSANFSFILPNGLSALAEGSSDFALGAGYCINENGGSDVYQPVTPVRTALTNVGFYGPDSVTNIFKSLDGDDFGTSSGRYRNLSFECRVRIVEWQDSGVLNTIVQDNLTEWTAYSGNVSNATTATESQEAYWRRVGDTIEVKGHYEWSGADTTTSLFAAILPSGLTVNEDKLPASNVTTAIGDKVAIGSWSLRDDSVATTAYAGTVIYDRSSNAIWMARDGSGGTSTIVNPAQNYPMTIQAEDAISWQFSLPITEWEGSQSSLVGFSAADENSSGLVSTDAQTWSGAKTIKGTTTALQVGQSSEGASRGILIEADSSSTSFVNLGTDGNSTAGAVKYNHSLSSLILRGNSTDLLYVDGNVGVNDSSPSYKFTVKSANGAGATTSAMGVIKDDANTTADTRFIQFEQQGPAFRGGIRRSGTSTTPEFFSGSDYRIKTNIQTAPEVLSKLLQVQVKTFDFKNDTANGVGVIAQELEPLFPDLVSKSDDGSGEEMPEGVEPWAVTHDWNYILIRAIQEQNAIIEDLKQRIEALEG